jgi:hypothetical protein
LGSGSKQSGKLGASAKNKLLRWLACHGNTGDGVNVAKVSWVEKLLQDLQPLAGM